MQTNQGSTRKMPLRTCLGCRTAKNKQELIRIVRCPDGSVAMDAGGKMNGRGAYVCRDRKCLEKVLKTGALSRSLKVQIPDEIGGRLLEEIES